MMVHVLFRSKASGALDEYPNLSAYVARGEARPAFKRAFAAQFAVFAGGQPQGQRHTRSGPADDNDANPVKPGETP